MAAKHVWKVFTITSTLLVFITLASSRLDTTDVKLERAVKELHENLMKEAPVDDPEAIIQAANSWLQALNPMTLENGKYATNVELVKTLIFIANLRSYQSPENCTRMASDFRPYIGRFSTNHPLSSAGGFRLERIVQYYMRKFAPACLAEMGKSYRSRREGYHKNKLFIYPEEVQLKKIFVAPTIFEPAPFKRLLKLTKGRDSLYGSLMGPDGGYFLLMGLVGDLPIEERYSIIDDLEAIRRFYDKNMLEACKDYQNSASKILQLARYDFELLEETMSNNTNIADMELLYNGLLYNHLCSVVLKNPDKYFKAMIGRLNLQD